MPLSRWVQRTSGELGISIRPIRSRQKIADEIRRDAAAVRFSGADVADWVDLLLDGVDCFFNELGSQAVAANDAFGLNGAECVRRHAGEDHSQISHRAVGVDEDAACEQRFGNRLKPSSTNFAK